MLDQPGTQAVRSPITEMRAVAERDEGFARAFERADSDDDGVPDRNLSSLYDAFYEADRETAASVVERTNGEYRSVLVTLVLDTNFGEREETVSKLVDAASTMEGEGGRTATVVGQDAIVESILRALTAGILRTMAIALTATVLVLMVVFRLMHGSATLGAAVSLPIALVVGMTVGGMYLLDIPLNLLTALLMSLVLGLGVDYNIHIGDRFADERREGKSVHEALEAAVTGTGGALLGSTLTSVGAFTALVLVPSAGIQGFGTIVVVALSTAFVVSVVALPSVIALWSRLGPATVTIGEPTEEVAPQD